MTLFSASSPPVNGRCSEAAKRGMALCYLPSNFSPRLCGRQYGHSLPFREQNFREKPPAAAFSGVPVASGELGDAFQAFPKLTGLRTRASLVAALASVSFSLSRRVVGEVLSEAAKYAVPARKFGEPRNLEEALMSVPDLESVNFKVLKRAGEYEIREIEPYFIAETTMPGKRGFNLNGSGQAFNILAGYLFGKNTASAQMEMTTPVFTRKAQSEGERMEMTTPVITKKLRDEDNWQMSFVMPSKYGGNLPTPKDPSVRIREVPRNIVAVAAFSGFVTDEMVKDKEQRLRDAVKGDPEFRVKENALVEVAQFNPPFTLPFTRRNEVSLEVEKRQK